jgi:pimeloyl-ACP methyl ester carboxylesterase
MSESHEIHLNHSWVNEGSDTRIIVLFLHEALGSIPQWRTFPEKLCQALGHKGLVYERRGHGHSSPLECERKENYLNDYALEELPQFLQSLESEIGDKKFLLVGHSDGGSIALLFASAFPEKVAAVITMAAHVINEQVTLVGIDSAVSAFKDGKLSGLRKYHGDKTTSLFYAWADTWRSEAFRNWNITSEISCKSIPVLALQGENDQYGTIEQLNLIQKHTGAEILLLQNCGHHPHIEEPEEVIKTITNFVRSITL